MFPHMIFKSNYEFSPATLNIIKVLFSPPFPILSRLSCPSPNDLPICYKVLSNSILEKIEGDIILRPFLQ